MAQILVEMRVLGKTLNARQKKDFRKTLRRACELEGLKALDIWIGESE